MSPPDPTRSAAIRSVLQAQVQGRLNRALAKISGTDTAAENERKKQRDFYQLQALLESSTEWVGQVQMATHLLKAIHPYAKVKHTSNLVVDFQKLPDFDVVSSHTLGTNGAIDATGNGAVNKRAYETFRVLEALFEGKSVLALLQSHDADAVAALESNSARALEIAAALVEIDSSRCERPATHTLAKQLYWPVGDDPHDDASYHLLAPLYPTSLVHQVYQTLQDDRFSEEAKAARDARRAGQWHARPVHEYPNLAIQKLGGTKPQNISQLNSERRGDNVLLASLPPVWRSAAVRPTHGVESLFVTFRRRPETRRLVELLRRFLDSNPARNLEARTQRDECVEGLLDELMQFTTEQHTLEPGWTADPQCTLSARHRAWLDPEGLSDAPPDLVDAFAHDFAVWLNHELRDRLAVGDAEYQHWRQQARVLFKTFEREDVL